MAGSVEGRTAVVTGAARGLGAEFCVALAGEDATVVGVDVADQWATQQRVERGAGRRPLPRPDGRHHLGGGVRGRGHRRPAAHRWRHDPGQQRRDLPGDPFPGDHAGGLAQDPHAERRRHLPDDSRAAPAAARRGLGKGGQRRQRRRLAGPARHGRLHREQGRVDRHHQGAGHRGRRHRRHRQRDHAGPHPNGYGAANRGQPPVPAGPCQPGGAAGRGACRSHLGTAVLCDEGSGFVTGQSINVDGGNAKR